MRKPVEIVEGDKSLRLNFYIILASFLLLIISVEPIIDFILLSIFDNILPSSLSTLTK